MLTHVVCGLSAGHMHVHSALCMPPDHTKPMTCLGASAQILDVSVINFSKYNIAALIKT